MSSDAQTTPTAEQLELQTAAKKAYLLYEQLRDMRANVRHIESLDGIAHFTTMANRKTEEIRAVVKFDAVVLSTLDFLQPIDTRTQKSEYPSAIVDGKRGEFMVLSGVLMTALRSFMMLYLCDADKAAFGVTPEFFSRTTEK